MKTRALILCLLSLALSARAGEAYTNLAGKAIVATPVKVEGGQVTFSSGASNPKPPATDIKLPLSVFPPSEQKRIKAAVGVREMPGELRGLAAEIASQRARYEARAKAGRISAEKLAENLELLGGSWRHAVEEADLPSEEKSYWKGKCP